MHERNLIKLNLYENIIQKQFFVIISFIIFYLNSLYIGIIQNNFWLNYKSTFNKSLNGIKSFADLSYILFDNDFNASLKYFRKCILLYNSYLNNIGIESNQIEKLLILLYFSRYNSKYKTDLKNIIREFSIYKNVKKIEEYINDYINKNKEIVNSYTLKKDNSKSNFFTHPVLILISSTVLTWIFRDYSNRIIEFFLNFGYFFMFLLIVIVFLNWFIKEGIILEKDEIDEKDLEYYKNNRISVTISNSPTNSFY
jgi:hypothetical protein